DQTLPEQSRKWPRARSKLPGSASGSVICACVRRSTAHSSKLDASVVHHFHRLQRRCTLTYSRQQYCPRYLPSMVHICCHKLSQKDRRRIPAPPEVTPLSPAPAAQQLSSSLTATRRSGRYCSPQVQM